MSSRARELALWVPVMLTLLYIGLTPIMPVMMGKLFPQASRLEIVSIEPVGPAGLQSRIVFRFRKGPADCAFVGPERGVEWYRGTRQNGVRVNAQPDPNSLDRGTVDVDANEVRTSSPWIVDMPPSALLQHAEAYFRFRCHPFWENLTRVW